MGSCGLLAFFNTSKGIRFNHRIDLAEYFIPSHREEFKHGQLMKEEENLNTRSDNQDSKHSTQVQENAVYMIKSPEL